MKNIFSFINNRISSGAKVVLFFSFVFLFWLLLMTPFLKGGLSFPEEAWSYNERIKAFVSTISSGVYPLWTRSDPGGVPNEFFLRRIGDYNPVYGLMVILLKAGLPINVVYLSFLCGYFFIGVIGFYLLARLIWEDRIFAMLAAMGLLFSCWGFILYYTYIVLILTPGIWFFYFFFSFWRVPNKLCFLGSVLTLMILLTTYIPVYFILILAVAVLVVSIVYFSELLKALDRGKTFFKEHPLVTFIGITAILCAMIPLINLFQMGKRGDIILPNRGQQLVSLAGNGFKVSEHSLKVDLGIFAHWNPASLVQNKEDLDIYTFYMSPLFYLLFFLGCLTRLNRRIISLTLILLIFFVIGSPEAFPIRAFLNKYFFVFKYFRNTNYLTWLIFLPGLILLSVGLFKGLFKEAMSNSEDKFKWFKKITFLHIVFLVYLIFVGINIFTVYFLVILSWLFWWLYLVSKVKFTNIFGICILLLAVLINAAEVYSVVWKSAELVQQAKTPLINEKDRSTFSNVEEDSKKESPVALWITTPYFNTFFMFTDPEVKKNYLKDLVIFYDKVQFFPDETVMFKPNNIKDLNNRSKVFVKSLNGEDTVQILPGEPGEGFRLLPSDVNHFFIETNFYSPKFLVLNDVYFPGWTVRINGEPGIIVRSNFAFKGILLPEGKNTVMFEYLPRGLIITKVVNFMFFYFIFIALLFLGVKNFFRVRQE
ncbi:MAG: hypothetical protein HQL25_01115 [Candidatus Omnitrophica bacterium]|nr:hypothetical protein [Candidatus Omnitrophota bacterium]